MQFLYQGGSEKIEVEADDVLELMAAANFFQIDALLSFCEERCSTMVNSSNVVSMYIHAKVKNSEVIQILIYNNNLIIRQ